MTEALYNFDTLLLLCISLTGYCWLVRRAAVRDRSTESNPLGFPDLLVVIVLSGVFVRAVLDSSKPTTTHPALKLDQVLPGALMFVMLAAGIGAFVEFRRISLTSLLGLRRMAIWKAVLSGIGLLILALPLLMWVFALLNSFLPKELSDEQQLVQLFREEAQSGRFGGVAKIMIAAVFLAPASEEFLFRGYFYSALKRYVGRVGGALITSAIFALLHANVASSAGLFVLALCLTAAYEWSGSLLVPMTMHATFNAMSLVTLYLHSQALP